MKIEYIIELILLLLAAIFVFALGSGLKQDEMVRQSLEGYRAFATYETNSIGEVKIKRIEWRKP